MRKLNSLLIMLFLLLTISGCINKSQESKSTKVSSKETQNDNIPKYVNYYGLKLKTCKLPKEYVAKIDNYLVKKEDYEKVFRELIKENKIGKDAAPLITKLDALFSIFYVKVLNEDMNNFFKTHQEILNEVLNGNFSIFNYTVEDLEKKNVCLKLNDNAVKILKEEITKYKNLENCSNSNCTLVKKGILKSIKDTIYFYEKVLKPLHLPKIVYYNWLSHHQNELSNIFGNNTITETSVKYLGNQTFYDEKENKKIFLKALKGACLAEDLYINGTFIAEKGTPLNLILDKLPKGFSIKIMYINDNDKSLDIFCQVQLNNNYQKLLFDLIKKKNICIDYKKLTQK